MNTPVLIPLQTLIFAVVFSLLLISMQQAQPALIYDRNSILAGEVWRIISGNLVHTNPYHLYMNLAGFWIFLLLCGSVTSLKLLISSIFLSSVVICTTLFFLNPEIIWYAGFSGVLYGLFVTGGVCLAISGELWAFIALLSLVIFKLGSIWLGDSDELTENLINASIIEEAHLYGAITGLITSLACFSRPFKKNVMTDEQK